MPKFIMFVHATSHSETGAFASPEEMSEMGLFNDQLRACGALLFADGLLASSTGARVTFTVSKAEPEVEPGPFQLENLVSGFWILKLDNLEEAISWAKRITFKTGSVEVRKIAGPEDFGGAIGAELEKRVGEGLA
jgi:hypothetical protein